MLSDLETLVLGRSRSREGTTCRRNLRTPYTYFLLLIRLVLVRLLMFRTKPFFFRKSRLFYDPASSLQHGHIPPPHLLLKSVKNVKNVNPPPVKRWAISVTFKEG